MLYIHSLFLLCFQGISNLVCLHLVTDYAFLRLMFQCDLACIVNLINSNGLGVFQIHETVETINQLKTNRDFFLGFTKDPQEFINNWLISQTRDLKVLLITYVFYLTYTTSIIIKIGGVNTGFFKTGFQLLKTRLKTNILLLLDESWVDTVS